MKLVSSTPLPVDRLLEIATRIEASLDRHVEDLNFGEYDDLREYATTLLACYHLLTADDPDAFLESQLAEASSHHEYILQRFGGQP